LIDSSSTLSFLFVGCHMARVKVDADSLRESASKIGLTVDRFDKMVEGFQTRLAACGEPYGNDELGLAIRDVCESVRDSALSCYATNTDGLDGVCTVLSLSADAYENDAKEALKVFRELLHSFGD
jgi:hypothetical protein